MFRVRALLGLGFGAAVVLHACSVYDESLLEGSKPVPKELWGSGVGWWSKTRKDGCISAGFPTVEDRPKNTPAGDVGDLYFALSSMALGSLDRKGEATDGAWKSLGFDLDGLCTLSPTCESSDPSFACDPQSAMPGDGDYCRDNTFGKLEADTIALQGLGKEFGLSNDAFNCALCRGDYNFMFRISGWNGEPNDSNVRLDLYPSPGIETPQTSWKCDLNAPLGSWKSNPCWTETDRFTIQTKSTQGTPSATELPGAVLNDPSAYVRDGYIVGLLPENTLFWFPGKSAALAFPLKLQRGIVVGKLVKDGESYRIEDGTIAGRARGQDLIEAFESLGLCAGHPLFSLANTQLGLSSDVLWTGNNSDEAACDSISVGIGFDARVAAFAGIELPPSTLPGCPAGDGGTDAATEAGSDAGADASSDAATDSGGKDGAADSAQD